MAADWRGFVWAAIDGRDGSNLAVYNGKLWRHAQVDIPMTLGSELAFDDENNLWIERGAVFI